MNKVQCSVLFTFVFCWLLLSCNKQLPQLPANKGNITDKNIAGLLEINQVLALKEDSTLQKFAKRTDTALKKHETGFWYKIDLSTNNPIIKDKDTCTFSYKMLSLNGKVLQEDDMQIVIGKKQLVVGLEEGLKILHKGESATFIIPWYLGYGRKGKDSMVPPYTSLMYKIKLYK